MKATDYVAKADNLFVLPDTVIKIKQLIDDDATSMEDIAEVINYDPAIMCQILKIANSALYKFPSTITTASKAIQVIGTRSVYDLVLAYGVAHAFKDITKDVIDLEKYWEVAVNCGLLAKHFAEELGIKEPEKLFVCGLLHNLGELVMVQLNPSAAVKASQISSSTRPAELQQHILGFCYADISAALLAEWGIPKDITDCLAHLHDHSSESMPAEYHVLQLSYSLALNNIYADLYSKYETLDNEQLAVLGLDESSVESALDFSNLQLMSALALFSPSAFSMF